MTSVSPRPAAPRGVEGESLDVMRAWSASRIDYFVAWSNWGSRWQKMCCVQAGLRQRKRRRP